MSAGDTRVRPGIAPRELPKNSSELAAFMVAARDAQVAKIARRTEDRAPVVTDKEPGS